MAKIENAEQLRAEINRLQTEVKEKELKLRSDLMHMKDQLKPENILMNSITSLTGVRVDKSEFFKNGLAMGISLVLQRFVFKTESTIERKVYSWIDEIFDRVKNYINKFSNRGNVGSEKIEIPEDEASY
jgi:hypothetical protein